MPAALRGKAARGPRDVTLSIAFRSSRVLKPGAEGLGVPQDARPATRALPEIERVRGCYDTQTVNDIIPRSCTVVVLVPECSNGWVSLIGQQGDRVVCRVGSGSNRLVVAQVS